jgi:hypothetical protein
MRSLVVAAIACTSLVPAFAHHSRSNFDLDTVIEIEGVITEFSWVNPHSFVVIEAEDDSGGIIEWTFELNSTPVLTRFGWNADALAVGDRVLATGSPDRNPDRRFIYANMFRKSDGTEFWSWGGPTQGRRPVVADEGTTDFSGVWRFRFQPGFDVLGSDRPDDVLVSNLPVTEKGQAQINAFDPDDNPVWDCAAESLPTLLGHPYQSEIIRDGDDRILMRYEVNNVERVIHMGTAGMPAGTPRSPLGYSVGSIEDRVLTIQTSHFSNVRWGAGRGVDSGEQKQTVERYTLSDDGTSLALEFTMTDPEYLTEPVTIRNNYDLLRGYALQEYTCDPVASRRHLTAGEE